MGCGQGAEERLRELLGAPAALVTGVPGCGKSSAVAAAARELGVLRRLTLEPGADPAPAIAAKLGVELQSAEELPAALARYGRLVEQQRAGAAAPQPQLFLVFDDAEELVARLSRTALSRLSEHDCPFLHVVLLCSSLAEPRALRCARAALPHLDCFEPPLPAAAGKAAWGWASGAQELLACLGQDGDLSPECAQWQMELVLAQALDDLLWPLLSPQLQRTLLMQALNWQGGECAVPFDEARMIPLLPATRPERARLVFHPAYGRLLAEKLAQLGEQELAALHRELAALYLANGKHAACFAHAIEARDVQTLCALDPFALLYTASCSLLDHAAGLLLHGQGALPAGAAALRFALRLCAALAVAGRTEAAQELHALAAAAPQPAAEQELLLCRLFLLGAGCPGLERTCPQLAACSAQPSTVFTLEDFAAADLEGMGFQMICACAAAPGSAEPFFAALAAALQAPSLELYYRGQAALLNCDFFNAKQLLLRALLAAEQGGVPPVQRSSLEALVELDAIQGNLSGANRFLAALERMPFSHPAYEGPALQQCSSFSALLEGRVDDIPSWLRNGDFHPGGNLAAARRFASMSRCILYLLKRRRVTKASTRVSFLEARCGGGPRVHEEGYLQLLKACCELDLGNAQQASLLMERAAQLLGSCGVLLPLALVSVLEPRYRALVAQHAPQAIELIESSELGVSEQRAFKEEALSKPSTGPLAVLTEREHEVALLAAGGFSNKEIAARLFITERTVKEHLTRCYKKLAVPDRLALRLLILKQQD